MDTFGLAEARQFQRDVIGFLKGIGNPIETFAIDTTMSNYWRDTREAIAKRSPADFRPTVTFFCLDSSSAFNSIDELQQNVDQQKAWLGQAMAAIKLLEASSGTGLGKIHSTMSKSQPNVLTVCHFADVLITANQVNRRLLPKDRLPAADDVLAQTWYDEVASYLKKILNDGVKWSADDPEHPYLLYRAVKAASRFYEDDRTFYGPLAASSVRIAAEFHRLAAGLALNDATPAEGVDLGFLWSSAALCEKRGISTIPTDRLEASIDHVLRVSEPLGDWPLGHAVSADPRSAVVPSGEIASALLHASFPSGSRRFSRRTVLRVLEIVRPIVARVMRTYRVATSTGTTQTMKGWADPRLVRDPDHLQSFTTSSHVFLLSRVVLALREIIRSLVVDRLGGESAEHIGGPGFAKLTEVDAQAPVGEFFWDTFVRSFDPLAPSLGEFRRESATARDESVRIAMGLKVEQERLRLPTAKGKNVSAILYGPPGTGKTTYAKALARHLEWPLITITPGNFMRAGESGVETAAQELFDLLSMTDRVVVLLDECDELFRSRDDDHGGARTLLSFLTGSMLPKLAALHDRGRLIFLVGTNYLERMDLAAIRGGRIDYHIAVPPPDSKARAALLEEPPDVNAILKKLGLVDEVIRDTEGLTRDELLRMAEQVSKQVTGGSSKTSAISEVRKILSRAIKGKMNDDKLLKQFYGHMQYNSAAVIRHPRWEMPPKFVAVRRTSRRTGAGKKV